MTDKSRNTASFFQNEITYNDPLTLTSAERIAIIRARTIEIREAQIQLDRQIDHLNQSNNRAPRH